VKYVEIDYTNFEITVRPSYAQETAMNSLPMSVRDWEANIHGKARKTLLEKGWVEIIHGKVILTQEGKDIMPKEKIAAPKVTANQEAAFRALAQNQEAWNDVHTKTKNFMIDMKWTNDVGELLEDGLKICEYLEIEVSENRASENMVAAKESNDLKTIVLTAKQIEAFKSVKNNSIKIWNDMHGKTKNLMVREGWTTDNGKLTELGQKVKEGI
jgi:predicted methyltransferase